MNKVLALVNIIVFGGMIYLNYLGGIGELNGMSTGDVSGIYPNLFTPAGLTFAIWSVIYLFNISFVIHQLIKAFSLSTYFDSKLNVIFLFICLTNGAWLMAWHHLALGSSMILMLFLLTFLIWAYAKAKNSNITYSYFTEHVNFSIYLGWISVATITNAAIFLSKFSIPKEGTIAAIITVVTILVALSLALFFIFKEYNSWYALVILWASYGIYVARSNDLTAGAEIVKYGALLSIIVIILSLSYRKLLSR